MEKYYKKKSINKLNDDIKLHIIEWWAQDEEKDEDDNEEDNEICDNCCREYSVCKCINNEYIIRCFGITENGESCSCKITGFKPYYYVKMDNAFTKNKLNDFLKFVESYTYIKKFKNILAKENGKHRSKLERKKDLFGFRNGKYYNYVKLVFNSNKALQQSRYLFKKPIIINNVSNNSVKYKLYESNIDGFMRYCHIKDILMAGWILLPKDKYNISESATTQISIEIDRQDVESLKEKKDIADFLQASWDIETYSYDYTFPDPDPKKNERNRENVIYQIATTYKSYKSDNYLVKHLLTLKKCDKIKDVIVEECANEKELIKKWIDTISKMDPDILYTYNGDTFDCRYLYERAKIYNMQDYLLKHTSRISDIPTIIKTETFSSSAYGDSDYMRFYIPGRLNYDLLIHYKRGMKKYSSYKLDYIANEILKQGKNDVSVKDIFKNYEIGTSDKIKQIGEYCIVDTELLQKLVDKQLILPNIMQLANVTFVPIGFLLTRGQTIKVFSQLLRKARQLDFLVPHTSFNENIYPLMIKIKDQDLTQDDLQKYIQVDLGNACVHANKKCDKCKKRIQNITLSCQIINIIENTLIVSCDTELFIELFNRSFYYNSKKYIITRLWPNDDAVDDSFSGATVLSGINGLHRDNVAILDFASLYPTIMISRNLCYSTFVMNDIYLNLDNVKYETIAWDDSIEYKMKQKCDAIGKSGKSKGQVCGKQAYFEIDGNYRCRIHDLLKKDRSSDEKYQKRDVSFSYTIVQPNINENGEIQNKGVLPSLLEELYEERKKVKREMNNALKNGNKQLADILDATQLAIKVSLNSTYGFLGRCQGNLILKELGSIVTSVGRTLIEQSKEYAENEFSQYIRENKLITYKLKNNNDILKLSEEDKDKFLKHFSY